MFLRETTPLVIALRVYPQPEQTEQRRRAQKPWQCPHAMLVFDTETRIDAPQRLTFGSYRFIVARRCLEEELFYADDIISKTVGLPTRVLGFEHLPAIGRTTISSPAVLRPLAQLNKGKKYPDQIKPFNFLIACHVSPLGHPPGVNPERFHLIAPYESDSRRWLKADWVDQYTGKPYRITTRGYHGNRSTARVKTYGEIALEYEFHPESKCADANGHPCGKQTVGLLQRRHIQIDQIKYIGKESNSLEEVESGLIHSAENVYTEYRDPRRDEWATKILPALKKAPLKLLVKKCRGQLSRRAIIDLRAGRSSRPHRKTRDLLVAILKNLGQSS